VIPETTRHGGSRIGIADDASAPIEDSAADALVRALVGNAIDMVFGVGGTHTLVLLGAIERSAKLQFVASRTELGAAYMAIGYARISGRPAALLTSTGPGALNVTAALQDAWSSSVPVIHLTTHIAEPGFAGAIHGTPQQNAILRTASKGLIELDGNSVVEAVRAAVHRARSAPAGPVTLTAKVGIWADWPGSDANVPRADEEIPEPPDIAELVEVLSNATRPLMYVGGGPLKHDRGRAALEWAEVLQAPLLTSNAGKTLASRDHPFNLGPWSTEPLVDELCAKADLAIALGSKLSTASTNYWKVSLPERTYRTGFADETHRFFPRIRELRGAAAEAATALAGHVRQRDAGWATDQIPGIRQAVLRAGRDRSPEDMAFIDAMDSPDTPTLVACTLRRPVSGS